MFSRRLFAAGVGMVSAVLAIGFSISAARAACNPSTQEIADCMPQGSPRSATRAPSRNGGSASRRGGGGGGGGAANIAGAAGNIAAGISNLIEGARVCPALARANEDSHAIDARHHALWRQYFGDENYAWQYTREDCAKSARSRRSKFRCGSEAPRCGRPPRRNADRSSGEVVSRRRNSWRISRKPPAGVSPSCRHPGKLRRRRDRDARGTRRGT